MKAICVLASLVAVGSAIPLSFSVPESPGSLLLQNALNSAFPAMASDLDFVARALTAYIESNAAQFDDDEAEFRRVIGSVVHGIDDLFMLADGKIGQKLAAHNLTDKDEFFLAAIDEYLREQHLVLTTLEVDLKNGTLEGKDVLIHLCENMKITFQHSEDNCNELSKNDVFNELEKIGFLIIKSGLKVLEKGLDQIEEQLRLDVEGTTVATPTPGKAYAFN